MGPLIKITLFYLHFSIFRHSSSEIGATRNIHRSSCPREFCKTVFLKDLAKFTRKNLCHYLFLIELLADAFCLIKKVTLGRSAFEILRTLFFTWCIPGGFLNKYNFQRFQRTSLPKKLLYKEC